MMTVVFIIVILLAIIVDYDCDGCDVIDDYGIMFYWLYKMIMIMILLIIINIMVLCFIYHESLNI